MTIHEDKNFISKCSTLGIRYQTVTRFNGNIAVRVENSNLFVFMNSNYDIIGMESMVSLGSALESMDHKEELYNKKVDFPYLNGLSLQDISELNNRVRFMRYGKIQVNNYFYPIPDDNEIVNMIGLLKFVNAEIGIYFRCVYPLMLASCDVKYDVLEFIRGVLERIWNLVHVSPNISALEVLNGIGQSNSFFLEKYLKYVIELFKMPYDKDYSNQMLRILDFPYDEEKAINDSYKLFSEMPMRSFSELVQDLECDKLQR